MGMKVCKLTVSYLFPTLFLILTPYFQSRGVYETPGGTILVQAARELESLTLDRETMQVWLFSLIFP